MSDLKIEVINDPTESFLAEKNVNSWSIWEKEISEFDWFYDEQEMCYILEGEVTVTPEGGDPVSIKKGDFVTFPKGMACYWNITKDIKKYYYFG